jgi:hypothetical protein
MIYAGIDPDTKGAIAFINVFPKGEIIKIFDRNDPLLKTYLMAIHLNENENLKVCQEGANVRPRQGGVSGGVQMESSGFWKGRLDMIDIEPLIVYPQTWRPEIVGSESPIKPNMSGMDKKAAGKVGRKHRQALKDSSVSKAIELFPSIAETYMKATKLIREGRAEALLIAEYCRRVHTGRTKKQRGELK